MRVYPKNRYVPGDYKCTCFRCGCDGLRSEMGIDGRTGGVGHFRCLDPVHPQDLIKPSIQRPMLKRDGGGPGYDPSDMGWTYYGEQ